MTKQELITKIREIKGRSAWKRGVIQYAIDIVDFPQFDEVPRDRDEFYELILNGAQSWHQYSYGACALVFRSDIAMRLCTPSELERNDYGSKEPKGYADWLDVQTEALEQAARLAWRTSLRK